MPSRGTEPAGSPTPDATRRLGASITGLIATPTYKMFTLDKVMSRDSLAAYEKHSRQFARRALAAIEEEAAARQVSCTVKHVVSDQPHQAILSAARQARSDLIVMSSHGRKGAAGLLLGSVAHKVLTHSKIPVLVCR